MKEAHITLENNQFHLKGEIDYLNAMSIYEASFSKLPNLSRLDFNFSELKSSDSSVIALMVEWIKFAKQYNKLIQFHALPAKIISLLELAGMGKLIK